MKIINFIKNNANKNEVHESVIEFGLEMIKTIIVEMVLAIGIAVVMHELWKAMLFLLILMPLRQYAGGFHIKSKMGCAVLSTIIYVSEIYVIKYVNICALAQIIGIFLSGVIIIIMAPVENYNNPLDATELLYYKKKTREMLVVALLIFMVLFIINKRDWSMLVVMAVELVAILEIMGYISNKIDKRRY